MASGSQANGGGEAAAVVGEAFVVSEALDVGDGLGMGDAVSAGGADASGLPGAPLSVTDEPTAAGWHAASTIAMPTMIDALILTAAGRTICNLSSRGVPITSY